jgi:hypothetical protein
LSSTFVQRQMSSPLFVIFARIVASEDPAELRMLSAQLQAAITEHIKRIRARLAECPTGHELRTALEAHSGCPKALQTVD